MLQTTTNINVDFYDKKYILINAKQLDKNSRFLSVTCYNHGELYPINNGEHAAYVRYRKTDNYGVFNNCNINNKGKIIVELTEQMLASIGVCYADLVIINKGDANVDPSTGEINEIIENASILSTMTFCIDVSEVPVTNSEIESTYEFTLLNSTLEKYWADFEDVMKTSKSWAVGNTGIRNGENADNAKYYYEQSKKSASESEGFKNAASSSATAANKSATDANTSAQNSQTYMGQAKTYMENAQASANASATSASAAATSETNASKSATSAQNSMTSASSSATSASQSATGAQNYYLQTEAIVNGLNGAFLPKGTITFAELMALESGTVAAGYLYNISDNFVTNDSFRMGAGVEYEAGTNVYFTADGYWDCLAGATVTGVKGGAETVYRKGNVDITPENVGAIPSADIATVDEMKNYLGIN